MADMAEHLQQQAAELPERVDRIPNHSSLILESLILESRILESRILESRIVKSRVVESRIVESRVASRQPPAASGESSKH